MVLSLAHDQSLKVCLMLYNFNQSSLILDTKEKQVCLRFMKFSKLGKSKVGIFVSWSEYSFSYFDLPFKSKWNPKTISSSYKFPFSEKKVNND